MKKIFFIIAIAFTTMACCGNCEKIILVENPTDLDRVNEMVEVPGQTLGIKSFDKMILLDAYGNQVAYQVMNSGTVIFQANTKPNEVVTYTFKKGNPEAVKTLVSARFVPERKDDFAWENDRAAYRMYGPALAKENPSNGVDLWLKRTNELVVDTFYYNELNLKQSYHIDHGKGLDCYKVGNKLGCGGIAPFYNEHLWVGKHFDRQEVIESGALRTVFAFEYDNLKVGETTLNQRIVITADAGAQLNKAVVTYSGDIENMQVAAGIFLHDVTDTYLSDDQAGWAAYAENAVSDAGIPVGRNYVAVLVPNATDVNIYDNTLLVYANYTMGSELTYYFGGGWSKWGYPTDEKWFDTTSNTARAIANPLVVTVK